MQNRRKKEEKIEICTKCEQNLIKFIKCFKIRKKLFTNQKKGGILTFVLRKRHSFKMPGFDLGGEIIMKKNLVAVLAAVVMTASMVACGSAAATETTVETATQKKLQLKQLPQKQLQKKLQLRQLPRLLLSNYTQTALAGCVFSGI